MKKVLIAGATGTTGKKVVQLLKDSDHFDPIAMVRKENQKAEFENKGIKTRLGDLENDISDIAKGVEKVIFAAGSNGKKPHVVDQEGAKKLIDSAKRANVSKFVMLSSMGADKPKKGSDLQAYFEAKHNADQYLRASLLPFSIIRPGSLTNEAGTGKIIAAQKLEKSGSISRDDVAKALVVSLSNDIGRDSSFEILSGETKIETALKVI
jgi:uncharacterized protein YbjT (DUF2867 family)